ncbi:MAG: glycosyltransferase family 2 protein [Hyphomicrobiaceae bacterium]
MSVSYLISSYNKCEYLRVVLQTVYGELQVTDGEVVIVDDGSSDNSWDIIVDFARRDNRISIHKQQNRGIFNVTNKLLGLGQQRWLRFIDCDDPLIPGSTEVLKQLAESKMADYVFGNMIPYGPGPLACFGVESQDQADCTFEILDDPLLYAISGYNHIPTAALISRRSLDPGVRLEEDLVSCQDLAVALLVFEHGRVLRVDAPVCWQLVGVENRLSSREALTFHQTIEILKRFGTTHFNPRYKQIAAKKVLSRSLRWMRRNALIRQRPFTYVTLLIAYGRSKVGISTDWEQAMTLATVPLARDVEAILQGQKIY